MRKNILAIVFMTVVFALSGYGQTGSPFVSKDGRFSVVAPEGFDKFELHKLTKPGDFGDVILNQYTMDLDRGSCSMVYCDLPDKVLGGQTGRKWLADQRDQIVKTFGFTLDAEEDLTIDGYPALSSIVHIPKGEYTIYVRMVFVLANSRSYNFDFTTPDKAELTKPDVVKFFNSIHIQK